MDEISKVSKDFGYVNVQEFGGKIAKVWDDDVFCCEKINSVEKEALQSGIDEEDNASSGGKGEAELENSHCGRLILVTAMTPNSHGVGKTTVSIGLADAMNALKKRTILALREPSMGPVFGVKGGGTGGGMATLEPPEKIDLHFTGDFHAIAQANNLLSSIIDNHIFQGNELRINQILHKRCLDVNDRSLREITYQIRGKTIKTGFNITAASEVMAIVALSKNSDELKSRLGEIMVAVDEDGKPVYAHQLHAENAMTKLLLDALKPNAVLSRGGSFALVHTGAFANIAHGASSLISISSALKHSDFCVTEAGFGSELGAEKFVNITSRELGKNVDACVLVITVSGVSEQGQGSLSFGFENVKKHLKILHDFSLRVVVAINRHTSDKQSDVNALKKMCEDVGEVCEVCEPFEKGGSGCVALAEAVVNACVGEKFEMKRTYLPAIPLEFKIEKIAKKVYGAGRVVYSDLALEKLRFAQENSIALPFVNIAKTPLSISDDKSLLNAPKNFDFHVQDIEFRTGAGMAVVIAGDMILMPGLGKNSRYLDM